MEPPAMALMAGMDNAATVTAEKNMRKNRDRRFPFPAAISHTSSARAKNKIAPRLMERKKPMADTPSRKQARAFFHRIFSLPARCRLTRLPSARIPAETLASL